MKTYIGLHNVLKFYVHVSVLSDISDLIELLITTIQYRITLKISVHNIYAMLHTCYILHINKRTKLNMYM